MSDFTDFATLKRPASPNTYLVAPDTIHDRADESATLRLPPVEIYNILLEMIAAKGAWRLIKAEESALRIQFTSTSALMRFKDDIDIAILPKDGDESELMIYSRSRVGYSDLGANRKRVQAIISKLRNRQNDN